MSLIKGLSFTTRKPIDIAVDDQGRIIISNPGSGGTPADPITGFSTEGTLQIVSNKLPSLIGGRIPVNVQSPLPVTLDTSVTPISVNVNGTISLPTGASTDATLQQIRDRLPTTVGQKLMAASLPVTLASDQPALPVTLATAPLPTGAATEATLQEVSGRLVNLGTIADSI